MLVEPYLGLKQHLPEILDVVEDPCPQQPLLQRMDESLGYPVTLQRLDKARARFDSQKANLLLGGHGSCTAVHGRA